LRAAYESIARFGLGKTSVDDVARIAKVSRATVYRHFPGGKEELIRDTVMWETAHVVEGLRNEVSEAEDLEAVLTGALVYGYTAVSTHEVLRKVLETEPERILPALLSETPWLVDLLAGFLVPAVRSSPDIRSGLDIGSTARHLARLTLSFITAPGDRDLTDPSQACELVRSVLLPVVHGSGGPNGESQA
jgi:AcrR family transcriptional regulator